MMVGIKRNEAPPPGWGGGTNSHINPETCRCSDGNYLLPTP